MSDVIKDLNEYQQGALRTLNKKDRVSNLLHCVLGMSGEAGEFAELHYMDVGPRIGELGDCMWYAAVAAHELGVPFADMVFRVIIEGLHEHADRAMYPEHRALVCASRMADDIKKVVFYNRDLDEEVLVRELSCYVASLVAMANKTGINLLDAGKVNLAKLKQRYPDKFDSDRAINRDYAAESVAAGVEIV